MDVICIGEALVDFLPERAGRRVAEVERWTRCSGGSPANVAVGLARLGAPGSRALPRSPPRCRPGSVLGDVVDVVVGLACEDRLTQR